LSDWKTSLLPILEMIYSPLTPTDVNQITKNIEQFESDIGAIPYVSLYSRNMNTALFQMMVKKEGEITLNLIKSD